MRLPFPNAWPRRFTLDRPACPPGCRACVDACKYEAIDLDATEREETVDVGGGRDRDRAGAPTRWRSSPSSAAGSSRT